MAYQSSGPVIVVNSLLCYALAKFSKMETLKLRSIICGFYSVDEVCGAKRQLLADIEQRKLLDSDICYKTHTVGDDFCAEMEMETDDIQDALSLLAADNSLCRLPIYVTDNPEKLPSIKLDDGDLAFLLAKMDKMQAVITNLHNVVHTLSTAAKTATATTGTLHSVTATDGSPRPPPTTVLKDRTHVAYTASALDRHVQQPGKLMREKRKWSDRRTEPATQRNENHGTASTDDNDDDDFEVYESPHRRKQRNRLNRRETAAAAFAAGGGSSTDNCSRKNPASASAVLPGRLSSRQPLLFGMRSAVPSSSSVQPIAAARTLKSVYCVDNIHASFDENSLTKFVSGLGVRVLTCYKVKPRTTRWQRTHNVQPDHHAFRICVNRADNTKFLNETKWPADITISRWFSKRADNNNADELGLQLNK